MKAIVISALGGPEVLKWEEIPAPPSPGAGQLLVRVKAAGVNPIDYKLRKTGALGFGPGKVLGFDVAGMVEAVGAGVSGFAVGDSVFYSPDFASTGGYAELHLTRADIVAKMPRGVSFTEAASIPLAGTTAWNGLILRGNLRLGQRILIAAANGGVGSIAVQIAKAAGAFVYGTCSTRSMDFVKQIPTATGAGPDRILNYQTEDWSAIVHSENPGGIDLVFDGAGQDVVSRCISLMKPMGSIVTIVNPSGKLDEAYRKNVSIHYEFLIRRRDSLEALAGLMERGVLKPMIDSVYPLKDAAEAHRKIEAGGVQGKIVLEVG